MLGVATASVALQLGCASLEGLRQFIQPPRFEQAAGQPSQVTFGGPSASRPLGGATVRLWARVMNPNPFGFTLRSLNGTLFLDGTRAAAAKFPLGLPLRAGEDTTIPLELSIDFSDLPALAQTIRRASRNDAIQYRLEGTVGVDAGQLGQPVFGPMTLLRGTLDRP